MNRPWSSARFSPNSAPSAPDRASAAAGTAVTGADAGPDGRAPGCPGKPDLPGPRCLTTLVVPQATELGGVIASSLTPSSSPDPAPEPVGAPTGRSVDNADTDPAPDPTLVTRAHRLLGYLEGLHRLRHPRDLDAIPGDAVLAPSLPDHPAVRIRPDADTLVEVGRVELPTRLTLPAALADRVEWHDVGQRPRLRPAAPSEPEAEAEAVEPTEPDGPAPADPDRRARPNPFPTGPEDDSVPTAAEAGEVADGEVADGEDADGEVADGEDADGEVFFTPPRPVDPVAEEFEEWLAAVWEPWFEQIRPTLEARRLFLALYDQRLAAERDLATHEVVWTRGVAVGRSPEGDRVRLPLFVRPVRYELDDQTGSLRVVATGPARLEIDPFELLLDTFDLVKRIESEFQTGPGPTEAPDPAPDPAPARTTTVAPGADTEPAPDPGPHPTDEPTADTDTDIDTDEGPDPALVERDVLERLSKVIAEAAFVPLAEAIPDVGDRWTIADIEGLFHRRRPVRYEAYFQALDRALDRGHLPDTWAAILADEPTAAPLSGRIGSNGQPWASLDDRILSPLALNSQQRSVLSRLSASAGVTVQGPPGTGKSYTIAALTSHFLTHGLRVLICAEKPHPLRVIRDQMPEELRRLCVAVLGDDRASNQQLEGSIGAITTRVNAVDPERDQAHLDDLDGHLDLVRRRLADLRRRELTIRRSEQDTLVIDGVEIGVAEAARQVASSAGTDGWLPDDVDPTTPPPLDGAALAELLDLTRRLDADDRRRHGRALVPADQLVSGAQLVQHWQALDQAAATVGSVAADLDLDAVAAAGRDHVQAVASQVHQHRRLVEWAASTEWSAVHRALAVSEPQRERWRRLAAQLAAEAQQAASLALHLAAHQIAYPTEVEGRDPGPLLAELRERFTAGRGLPRLGGGELKALVAAVSVDGRRPATVTDLDLIDAARRRDDHRRRLCNLWANEVVPLGLDPLDPARPEDVFQTTYQPGLQTLIDLPATTAAVADAALPLLARPAGPEVVFDRVDGLDVVAARLQSATALFDRDDLTQRLDRFTATVAALVADGHPTNAGLHAALLARDSAAWDIGATETHRLHRLTPTLDRHAELVATLETAAPRLAESLRHDDVDRSPDEVVAAWRWRQLRHWIDGILGLGDLSALSARITETEREEQRLLTEVVTNRAWLELARRTTGAERSALETWAQAMARVGKGTGRHAPRHRRTAQQAMRQAQGAVPVWIMSIAQAIDSFRPGHDSVFDVVIVDEASQAPLDALAVLGLGQRVLVVGDDKQISPTVITDETEADRLRRQHLVDVPDAEGFDIRTSLYDTASRRFPGVIQLQEHFRCLPEIIAFSNRLAYEGRIDPLREHHPDPAWPVVQAVAVEGGYRDGAVNPPEVEAVADLVTELLDDPALAPGTADYPDGASIGVVCMVGQDQAKAIQGRLIETLAVEEIEARRIRVGSPYEFQGDERDVIIVSMLDAPVDDPDGAANALGPVRVTGQAATSKAHQQRFNVAASRARDRLVVVHSFDPADLAEADLRRQLVAFAQHPATAPVAAPDLRGRCRSGFERDVLERLEGLAATADLELDAQYPVAGYRIDFTVTDRRRHRVAVECDGDLLRTENQLLADAERQRVLERLGWRFARIRASEFYTDPDRAFAALVDRLADHDLDLTPVETVEHDRDEPDPGETVEHDRDEPEPGESGPDPAIDEG